jgi:large-conductance mechanosensitive channel
MIDIAIGAFIGAAFIIVWWMLVKEFATAIFSDRRNSSLRKQKLILWEAQVVGDVTNEEIKHIMLFETSIDFLIISLTVLRLSKFINQLKIK